jgi:hypothetical protein
MKCRRVIGQRHRYWNIKGWGHFGVFVRINRLFFRPFRGAPPSSLWQHLGTTLKRGCFVTQKTISRKFRYPSAELREQVRAAVKGRVFRSEQAFLIAACEHDIRLGANTEATAYIEARVAATLTNLSKQVQGLQKLAHAQVALTDVFLKYVITCVVKPPGDALPAARVRARLRYEKRVRDAAEEISNKNRDIPNGMVADE